MYYMYLSTHVHVGTVWYIRHLQTIECADLDGSNRRVLVENVPHPYGLAVSGDAIYWTDWKLKAVARADKRTGEWSRLHEKTDGLMAMVAVHMNDRDALPQDACADNNGGCSHLCLRQSLGFSCACPTGILLQKDNKTCLSGKQLLT